MEKSTPRRFAGGPALTFGVVFVGRGRQLFLTQVADLAGKNVQAVEVKGLTNDAFLLRTIHRKPRAEPA